MATASVKHRDQKQLGKERVYLFPLLFHITQFIIKGSQEQKQIQGRNPEAGVWCRGHEGVLLTGLLSLLSSSAQERLDGTPHNGLGSPLSITN